MKLFKVLETSFELFDSNIRGYLSKTFDRLGLEYTHNQVFGIIYDGIKAILQNVMFYIEDAMTEQNIYTASRKKSIYSLAKLSGYEAYMGCAATGTVILQSKITDGVNNGVGSQKIYIPNGTRIVNGVTGIQYIMLLPADRYLIDTAKALTTHEVKIVEGLWGKSNFTANGYNFETVNIYSDKLFDRNYVEVYVDGEKWSEAANMYEMTENGKEYVISIGFDNTFDVMFGNGVYGKKLIEGQNILVRYIQHTGTVGNVSTASSVVYAFYDNGYDVYGNDININDFLKIIPNGYVSGGLNEDSIQDVRKMIGYNSRALVLANEDNFKLFFNRFSFVSKANIWSEQNSMNIYACLLGNGHNLIDQYSDYLTLTDSDFIVTDEEKNIISNVLSNSNKTFAGVTVQFIDPVLRKYSVMVYVKPTNLYEKESIKTGIEEVICKYFMNLDNNVMFIPKSDIIQAILNSVDNIEALDIAFISKTEEDCFKNGYYTQYEMKYINNKFNLVETKVYYEASKSPGLDKFGNIELSSKLEIPLLTGGISYYPDKTNKDTSITTEAIQYVFI